MASTINASTSPTSGVITTADNSGVLQLQGNGAAGVTVNSYGALGLGASADYGTTGQVLTSQGTNTPPTWTAIPTPSAATATVRGIVYGFSATTGIYGNTSLGYKALETSSSPQFDGTVAIGSNCLNFQSGFDNTAIGTNVGANATSFSGSESVFVGGWSALVVSSGTKNVSVGYRAAYRLTTGSFNAFVGHQAGQFVTTGAQNTLIGYNAGTGNIAAVETGSNNIVIGYNAGPSSVSVSNEITLGNESINSLRIPGLQAGKASGDVLTYDGSKITLAKPSLTTGKSIAMAMIFGF